MHGPKIGVDALFELTGTDRSARAYAFLYAAFRKTEISANPVRDALDCLIPFIAPYLNTIAGKQVTFEGIKTYLKMSFGFDIPLYAIEQLTPELQRNEFVEFNKTTHAYIARRQESRFDVTKSEIATEFDDVTRDLAEYARAVGFPGNPPSGSWGEALISFLRTRTDIAGIKVTKIKGVLLDPRKVEVTVVGGFVKALYSTNSNSFSKILNIFMGVLVEEFIASIYEIGNFDLNRPVNVFYDTAVLLRLLGSSGRMHKVAAEELTRYLQDIGFRVYYLSGNEAEVVNILETILYRKDTGKELEGETAEAIGAGDVSITDLRLLRNDFPERLAALSVFPASEFEREVVQNAKYQIDERGFSEFLNKQASAAGRVYGFQNRINDASYLAAVMRLRKNMNTRDLAACGFVFVTTNRFLAAISRRYLIEQRTIARQHCPPILSVGQIATIAWLMKDQQLAPEKAGRELLANCFAAVRPDAEWFRYFREGVEKAAGSVEEMGKDSSKAMTLHAARRIAQEESFSSSAIVRELNMAEILQRAEQETGAARAEREAEYQAQKEDAELRLSELARHNEEALLQAGEIADRDKKLAVAAGIAEATRVAKAEVWEARKVTALGRARTLVTALKVLVLFFFVVATSTSIYLSAKGIVSPSFIIASLLLGLASIVAFMDLLRFDFVTKWHERLITRLTSIFMN